VSLPEGNGWLHRVAVATVGASLNATPPSPHSVSSASWPVSVSLPLPPTSAFGAELPLSESAVLPPRMFSTSRPSRSSSGWAPGAPEFVSISPSLATEHSATGTPHGSEIVAAICPLRSA
jgi:hypothetical protein